MQPTMSHSPTSIESDRNDIPRAADPTTASARGPRWALALLILAVTLTFAPVLRNGFLAWDDDKTIEHNPRIEHPSAANLLHYWRHPYMDLYVPVTYTAWSGIAWASRLLHGSQSEDALDPRLFHAASLLLHLINTLLAYGVLRRLVKRPWPAAAGALLFALHPVQVEAVAWASGLKDLLCATFSLMALGQYLAATGTRLGKCRAAADIPVVGGADIPVCPESASAGGIPPAERTRNSTADKNVCPTGRQECLPHWQARMSAPPRIHIHYCLGLAALLLGMLSKPSAIVVPLLAAILDRLVLRRPPRRVLISIAPWVVLTIPCILWTRVCQPPVYLHSMPLWVRPLVASDAIAFYFFKLFFPLNLAFDYGRAPWVVMNHGWLYYTWIVPVVTAGVLIVRRRANLELGAAALLLVAALVPVLGLSAFDFQMISTVADHYLYLAMLGPALAAAWWLSRCHSLSHGPAQVACVVLGLLAVRSSSQLSYWHDSRSFFTHTLEVTPDSWSSYHGLAFISHNEGQALARDAEDAARAGFDPAPLRMAADEKLTEAMGFYRQELRLNRGNLASWHGYGAMLMYFHRYGPAAEAFAQVVRRRPQLSPPEQVKFFVDTDLLGQALFYSGRLTESAHQFRAALTLNPTPPEAAKHLQAVEAALAATRATPGSPQITDTAREATQNAAGPASQ